MADGVKYKQDGDVVDITPAADVVAGDVYIFASTDQIGIVRNTGVAGELNAAAIKKVHTFPKQAALAISDGALVYWDDTAKEIDTTNTNTPAGRCRGGALAADTTVDVELNMT